MVQSDSFEDPIRYKTLVYISDKLNDMPKNKKEYIGKYISNFNYRIKYLKQVCSETPVADSRNLNKINMNRYIYHLVKDDYLKSLIELEDKFDKTFVSYLRNFIISKLRFEILKENIK